MPFFIFSFTLTWNAQELNACTLWAATGSSSAGGGTLIAKNRDWIPDHTQELKVVTPKKGHPFLGLYALGNDEPGCKAGANNAGLVIVSSAASSIPKAQRHKSETMTNLIPKLLSGCATVEEVLEKHALFEGPRNLMVADRKRVAVIEIGPGGSYATRTIEQGTITHTNHYLYDQLVAANVKIGISSKTRLERIQQLLQDAAKPLSLPDFLAFSTDRNDGPTKSIFRTGDDTDHEKTLATWIAGIAPDGSVTLDVTLFNPSQEPKHTVYTPAQFKALFVKS